MTHSGKLTQSKSSLASEEMAKAQNWISLVFKNHIRGNRLSKSSGFKSPQRRASSGAASSP